MSQTALKDYMEGVLDEIRDIPVEDGSNKQLFKTYLKMTSRLHYVKTHTIEIVTDNPQQLAIVENSIKADEIQMDIYRNELGLPPKYGN